MSENNVGWESILQSDCPSGCELTAALFTTYDQAENQFLAEHVLPELLNLDRRPESEGIERQYFLLDLDQRLKRMKDRIFVVSSTRRDEPTEQRHAETQSYAWIGRLIRQVTVGQQGHAVQHAKLWMLHWQDPQDGGRQFLEMIVSSTNLTRSAFRDQIQGAWRACLLLSQKPQPRGAQNWGILPDFIQELAKSTGEADRFQHFVNLLGRASCPRGVSFVASVPGNHSPATLARQPWGVAGLAGVSPQGKGTVSTHVLSPFIGSWNESNLEDWCDSFGGSPERLSLAWISVRHEGPEKRWWRMPEKSRDALQQAGAEFLHLRQASEKSAGVFHKQHRAQKDPRWSHAKVYAFRRGSSCRLLMTSANFSTSAWGVRTSGGGLEIRNFELGVCVEQVPWPLEELDPLSHRDAATTPESERPLSQAFSWASASWNGEEVTVMCRCRTAQFTCLIVGGPQKLSHDSWTVAEAGEPYRGTIAWKSQKYPPERAILTCENESLEVAVFDDREDDDRDMTVPPEVDCEAAILMADELLYERYGGPVAGTVEDSTVPNEGEADAPVQTPAQQEAVVGIAGVAVAISGDGTSISPRVDEGDEGDFEDSGVGTGDSYSVPAFVRARRYWQIIDNWSTRIQTSLRRAADALEPDAADALEIESLVKDGEKLAAAFHRQVQRDRKTVAGGQGANLANEEMTIRLKHVRSR